MLDAAIKAGGEDIPVYVREPVRQSFRPVGAALA